VDFERSSSLAQSIAESGNSFHRSGLVCSSLITRAVANLQIGSSS